MKLAGALRPALAFVGLALSTCNRDQPLAPASPHRGTPSFEIDPSSGTMPTWIDLAPSGGPPTALGSLVADPTSGRVIVFGGLSPTMVTVASGSARFTRGKTSRQKKRTASSFGG